MADLLGGSSSAPVSNGRAQNGGSRATSGPIPVPQPHYRGSGVRTPTDIMRQRAAREAKKKAESESRQRARNDEQRRPQEHEVPSTDRRDDTAGVAPLEIRRRSGDPTSTRRSGEVPSSRPATDRRSGDRRSGGDPKINQPVINQPLEYKNTSFAPPQEPPNITNITTIPQSTPKRRGTSLSQDQPRPVQASNRATSAPQNTQQQPQTRNTSTAAVDLRSQPNPSANMAQTQAQGSQESNSTTQQRGTTSSFPHAFERWETLSSHWEGLTSYWIRRLQNNSDEMNREPLNQQMARQVTDLSAAGANLFHAVVELQRLRASSERKFQRWFFDTRSEQERAREVQARLENELRKERQEHAEATSELNRVKNDVGLTTQDQGVTEQMLRDVRAKDLEVKEMRRELQISKEEARRAWEELGRREQEERDRTTSLRAGEPTLVGGVQVVPMLQGAPSRQESSNRPSTRDGPLPTVPSTRSGQPRVESPSDEPGYTNYDPARSETDTDPFTENGRQQPVQASIPASQPQQQTSNGSSAATQATRSAAYVAPTTANSVQPQTTSAASTAGGTYLRYGPGTPAAPPAVSSFYQHEGSSLLPEGEQPRGNEPDDRSFVPSNDDTFSEEEYEYDGNGQVRRDAQGNPMVYGRGAGSEDSDEYDVQDQLDRERMYGQRYGSGLSGVEYGSGPTSTAGPRGQPGRASEQVYSGPADQASSAAPVDYSGSAYGSGLGWEAIPRHHHPTRLSDVLEEDERSRTSASRASQTSRGLR